MKRVIPFIVIAVLVGSVAYWYTTQQPLNAAAAEDGPILASGTIEAETISIAAETGGRILNVHAGEGDEVEAGQLLVELDPGLLLAQRAELEAAIATAQANLAAVMAGPRPEEIAVAEADLKQVLAQRGGAYQTWQQALRLVEDPQELLVPISEGQAVVKQAERNVELAQAAAKTAEIQTEAASRNQRDHEALVQYEIAQKQRDAANVGVKLAEAQLAAARVQVAHLWEMYNNPIALQVQANQAENAYNIAQAAVTVARARLAAARAETPAEEVAVARAQLRQAESALALLDVQLDKLLLVAPRAGLVSTRIADPGELASPGATLLNLADLDRVTLTVFIPETQIGRVKLGQQALVTIDSVSQVFEGEVSFIANEAEFTPKNVQTQEERVNLVFAVEITLDNPEHILKPGMPADAEIVP
ncbi:MAG: HlyD family secretion protein [Anaerolineae bacterium]